MISRYAASNSFLTGQNPSMGQPRSSTPMIDKCAIVPISACVFALIVSPLLLFFTPVAERAEWIPAPSLEFSGLPWLRFPSF